MTDILARIDAVIAEHEVLTAPTTSAPIIEWMEAAHDAVGGTVLRLTGLQRSILAGVWWPRPLDPRVFRRAGEAL